MGCALGQTAKVFNTIDKNLPTSCIEISPNKKVIAISDDLIDFNVYDFDNDYNIIILNSSNYEELYVLKGHRSPIKGIGFSVDSKRLISTDSQGVVKVWDIRKGELLISLMTGDWVNKGIFVGSGYDFMIIQGYEKVALLYDENGDLISKFNVGKQINDFAYNPLTHNFYFGCHEEFQVWSVITRELVYKTAHEGLNCMEFNHDYSYLAIGTLKGIQFFTPDLELISSWGGGHFKPVLDLSFSFNNRFLATSSCDQTARVWKIESAKEIFQLVNKHKGCVYSIEFISNDNKFITGGENNEVQFWRWR